MRNILIFDRHFAGKHSSTYGINLPLNFRWLNAEEQFGNPDYANIASKEIVVYTDHCLTWPDKIGKIKIGWLIEPEEYIPDLYQYIKENYDQFDYIFTWNKELLFVDRRFIFLEPGNSWMKREDIQIYNKTKLTSMIASEKKFMAGHCFRRHIFERYSGYFDQYGRDTNPVNEISEAFKDYRFTVVVENTRQDYMFTEKLITPLLCGTIPIYYGCPSIGKFFNMDGIITFTTEQRFNQIITSLSDELYEKMLPAVEDNFHKARKYQLLEDNLYIKLIQLKLIGNL